MKLSGQQWGSLALSVLAAGSLLLVLVTKNLPSPTDAADRANNLIRQWRDDEVKRVTFASGGRSFRIERTGATPDEKGSEWTLHAPDREPADGAAVDRLISGLGFATRVRLAEGDPISKREPSRA